MTVKDEKADLAALRSILAQVGPGGIWRPVHDQNGNLLADGVGDPEDGLANDVSPDFFQGKRIIDIGCNFGAFSFLAARRGAHHVLGVDIDDRIISGCRILQRLLGIENVDFLAADLRQLDKSRPFDLGMMIDFIGKSVIHSGFLPTCLDVIEAVSKQHMPFSIRPIYDIRKHLNGDRERLVKSYPADVVRTERFLLLEYLKRRYRHNWLMEVVSSGGECVDDRKQTVLFERR